MAGLSAEWISFGGGDALRTSSRFRTGTSVAGARIPSRPGIFIFAGVPARGPAPERAVSRFGEPERGILLSTAAAHDGRRGPRRDRQHPTNHHESHTPINHPAVLRVAGPVVH